MPARGSVAASSRISRPSLTACSYFVPGFSPATTKSVFFDTLLDENAASHIAFGSIRMEPVFMVLGQSAATAAALALDDHVAVQQLGELDQQRVRATQAQCKALLGQAPQRIGQPAGQNSSSCVAEGAVRLRHEVLELVSDLDVEPLQAAHFAIADGDRC